MKIQCNACEKAEAKVLCCADEAALCHACDEKVHSANKLAGKHQRVSLSGSASQVPNCDICKEDSGYFFCLEDRALLCRKCDIGIHSANSLVSAHQRFLLTGVKVRPEAREQVSLVKEQPSPSNERKVSPSQQSYRSPSMSSDGNHQKNFNYAYQNTNFPSTDVSFTGGAIGGSTYDWPPEEFFDFGNFNQNYGFIEASKADSGKLGSLEGSPIQSSTDEEVENQLFNQVSETWMVPDIPFPPTASGLNWPKSSHRRLGESFFVPDICYDSPDLQQCRSSSPSIKRRRAL